MAHHRRHTQSSYQETSFRYISSYHNTTTPWHSHSSHFDQNCSHPGHPHTTKTCSHLMMMTDNYTQPPDDVMTAAVPPKIASTFMATHTTYADAPHIGTPASSSTSSPPSQDRKVNRKEELTKALARQWYLDYMSNDPSTPITTTTPTGNTCVYLV